MSSIPKQNNITKVFHCFKLPIPDLIVLHESYA